MSWATWAVCGILYSLFKAAFAEINRIFRVDGRRLNFWHAAFGMLILLPFLSFVEWDLPLEFYWGAAVVSLIATSGSLTHMLMAEKQMARVSGMYMPMETIAAFFIWGFVTPGANETFISDPVNMSLIVLSFVLMSFGLMKIRSYDTSLIGFISILPGAVSFGAAGAIIKMLMMQHLLPGAAFTFVYVNYAVMALIMMFVLLIKGKGGADLLDPKLLKAGAITGFCSVAAYICFIYSLANAVNPAYTITMTMLVPVWLFAYHKIRKIEEMAMPKPAALIVGGVIILLIANI
jgi:hypothetical protein